VARTIADLIGAERIKAAHLAEAIHLRPAALAGVMVQPGGICGQSGSDAHDERVRDGPQ
jgi:hypothetical protein